MEEIDPKALDIFAPIVTEKERREQGLEKINARLYAANKLVDTDGVQHPKPRPDDPDELFAQVLRDLKRVLTLFEQWVEIKKEKRDAGR